MNMFAKMLAFSPSDMKSDFDYFPFMGALGNIANGTQGAALMILAIVFIVAVAGWVISKVSNSGMGQKISLSAAIICLIAAALIASSGGLINWATQQKII